MGFVWAANQCQRGLLALAATHEVLGYRLVGWELPLVIAGVLVFSLVFILRTVALGLAIYRRFFYKHRRSPAAIKRAQEGVTILKPLKGVDKNLEVNLESFFNISYPKFEILFSVDSEKDPAGEVAQRLIAKYPSVDARLIYSEDSGSKNPKINNMMTSYRQSKYEIIWQSDSNIIVTPHELGRMVDCLDDSVGLVHQLPLAANPKTIAAQMEWCYLSTWHATMYLFFNYCIDTHCVVGKSLVFHKSKLDALGGLKRYSDYLAEDWFVAKDFWLNRFPSRISADASTQNLGDLTFWEYWSRQERWNRLRFSTQPGPTFLEIFTNIFVNGLLSYHAMSTLLGIAPLTFLWTHSLIWFGTDLMQIICFYGLSSTHLFHFLLGWILRETVAIPLTISAATGDTVLWRGKMYRISEGSVLSDFS